MENIINELKNIIIIRKCSNCNELLEYDFRYLRNKEIDILYDCIISYNGEDRFAEMCILYDENIEAIFELYTKNNKYDKFPSKWFIVKQEDIDNISNKKEIYCYNYRECFDCLHKKGLSEYCNWSFTENN